MRANQLCNTCLVSVQLSLREMSLQIKTNPKGSGLFIVTVHDEYGITEGCVHACDSFAVAFTGLNVF